MPKSITIRPGRIKDKDQVLAIWQELMEYHMEISSIDYAMVDDAPQIFMKFFENNVRSKNKKAIVAEDAGKVIGYMLGAIQKRPPLFKTTHHAFITDAAVLKSKRNLGVGTKLLDVFTVWAKEKGMTYIALAVVPENDIGRNFWKKHGFETIMLNQLKML